MIRKSQEHLKKAQENYFEHMVVALKISFKLLTGALMALTHAFIPSIFTSSASSRIKQIYFFIENRKKN